jgi:hypothetical protein
MALDENREMPMMLLFESTTRRRYAPHIIDYCDVLLNCINPIFDDLLETEAPLWERILGWQEYKKAREVSVTSRPEGFADYRGYWGIGVEESDVRGMQYLFLAMGVAGLFHIFERQLYEFINYQLRLWLVCKVCHWRDLAKIIGKFDQKLGIEGRCLDLIDAFKSDDLSELALVANAIKHGTGSSYDNLVKSNAVVVSKERLFDTDILIEYDAGILNMRMLILPEDVERYRNSILRFWELDGPFCAATSKFSGVDWIRSEPDWRNYHCTPLSWDRS